MPNPYNPNPYNEEQDRARQQPLYDQPGGPRQDASQEYHKGDGVFQIPWWVIVITFCFAAWPIGVAMMIINHLLRMGKISAPQSWSQNNRQTGQPYTVRPIYADPQKAEKMRRDAQRVVQRAEEAAHKADEDGKPAHAGDRMVVHAALVLRNIYRADLLRKALDWRSHHERHSRRKCHCQQQLEPQ